MESIYILKVESSVYNAEDTIGMYSTHKNACSAFWHYILFKKNIPTKTMDKLLLQMQNGPVIIESDVYFIEKHDVDNFEFHLE